MGSEGDRAFSSYFEVAEPRLRAALVAAFGPEDGREAAADALAWGWSNWDRLQSMRNPDGYLYRVGRNQALRNRSQRAHVGLTDHPDDGWRAPEFEPALGASLASLPERQRVSVWLVHGLGYTLADSALVLGCSRSTVATHVRRALATLRLGLEAKSES